MNVTTLDRPWQEIALWRLLVFALERDFEGMQFSGHQAGYNCRITLHKGTGGPLIRGLENGDPKSLIPGFHCFARQDQLTRFDRVLEPGEVPIQCHFVLTCPGSV